MTHWRRRKLVVLVPFLLVPTAAQAHDKSKCEECACNSLFIPLLVFFFLVVTVVLIYGAYTIFLAYEMWRKEQRMSEMAPHSPPRSKRKKKNVVIKEERIKVNLSSPKPRKRKKSTDSSRSPRGPPTAEQMAWSIPYNELKLGRLIGSGNVGVVHEGEWHGTKVAVKKLVSTWLDNKDMVLRFREEINLMSKLHHPNVLMFIGAVMDPDAGNICLVTELCIHGDLYTFLQSPDTRMTWKRRLMMATDVARGMLYLHRRAGIIQRDLKPANCLIDEHFHIKIADFGLSRIMVPGNMETYCGTPANMAPEIVRQEDYDEKADVFSFAITLWEIVTREDPYPDLNGMTLAFQVAERGLRPKIPTYCPEVCLFYKVV